MNEIPLIPKTHEEVFDHIMFNILRAKPDRSDPLSLALIQEDLTNPFDMLTLDRKGAESLEHHSKKEKVTKQVPR